MKKTTEDGPAVTGPRAPKRTATLAVPEYPGFTVTIWSNYPRRLWTQLFADDDQVKDDTLHQLVLEHNGWCDQDGAPYPPSDDPTFYEAIPNELVRLLVQLIAQAPHELPNSLLARRAN